MARSNLPHCQVFAKAFQCGTRQDSSRRPPKTRQLNGVLFPYATHRRT